MKRFVFLLTIIFMCSISHAETFNQYWYVENNTPIQTTCETGGDITLPTAPTKYGYDFIGWEKLPYIRIEYLESTGTQYIDTGVYANGLIRMKAKIETMKNGGANSAFSGVITSGSTSAVWQVIYPYNGIVNINIAQEPHLFNQNYIGVQEFDVDQVNKKITFNGVTEFVTKTPIAVQAGHANIPLFRYQNELNPSGNYWYGKVYYVQIYDNDVLVRDMIPVLDGNGTPCMFDKVEGKFYYNAGTGDFIAGPVIGE